jgi:hypothetical protein
VRFPKTISLRPFYFRKAKEEELRMEEEEQRTLDAINEKAKGKHRLT